MNEISDIDSPSPVTQRALAACRQAAATNSTVLLLGETGSGKDFWARYIHEHSKREGAPFLSINCAALPSELVESELFGHEKGAFTGAHELKKGLVELAESGTLLLNEVGDLPLFLQAKLLIFLDTRDFRRVGGQSHVKAPARIIAATNRNLEEMVAQGSFRADLYYRLKVVTIHVPALRERIEDLPILAQELFVGLRESTNFQRLPELHKDTLRVMAHYAWPGNVRELRNVLEKCLILSGGDTEEMNALMLTEIRELSARQPKVPTRSLHDHVPAIIVELLTQAAGKRVRNPSAGQKGRIYSECIVESGWTQARVAKELGVSASTVSKWLKGQGQDDEQTEDHEPTA